MLLSKNIINQIFLLTILSVIERFLMLKKDIFKAKFILSFLQTNTKHKKTIHLHESCFKLNKKKKKSVS